jgi:ketosteroid isomerase-like protein
LIEAVERRYFANLDAKNLEATLECFTSDAVLTIQSAFSTHVGRDTGIRQMFERLFERYEKVDYRDFSHVVDLQTGGCASRFEVENVTWDGEVERLSNCNFFWFDGAKFKEVWAYPG